MRNPIQTTTQANRLLFLGILLFLFGLIVSLFIPVLANPRMGLSAHLEGTMNGMFLVILGLIWERLVVKDLWRTLAFYLTVYGSFANFAAVALGAMTGAGKMMPLAGGKEGTMMEEGVISFLLVSLSLAMLAVCLIVLAGINNHIKSIPKE